MNESRLRTTIEKCFNTKWYPDDFLDAYCIANDKDSDTMLDDEIDYIYGQILKIFSEGDISLIGLREVIIEDIQERLANVLSE